MATVTTTILFTAEIQTFERPHEPYTGPQPYGEVVFSAQGSTIAAKGAADTMVVTSSGTLPSGFVYRPVECRAMLSGVNEDDLQENEAAMGLLLTENQVTLKQTMMFSPSRLAEQSASVAGQEIRNPSVTNDFSAIYGLLPEDQWLTDIIDASQGSSILQTILVNNSGNATGALSFAQYYRFLMYTIQQYRNAAMWSTVPIF